MFSLLFKSQRTALLHQNGPLSEERLAYIANCTQLEMSLDSIRRLACYLLNIANWLRLKDRPGERISRSEIDAEAERWVSRKSKARSPMNAHRLRVKFKGHAIRWLTFADRLVPIITEERASTKLVALFTDYLCDERGLSAATIEYSRVTIQEFMNQIDASGLQLETISPLDLDRLVAERVLTGRFQQVTTKRWATAIRPFLRFGARQHWCRDELADTLHIPRVMPQSGLPVGPSWEDVKKILASVEGDTPVDIRDRALLLLLSVYGLRSGEVVALQLKDFDWERSALNVSLGKSKRQRTYPLCRPVGDAVLKYLQEVRPQSKHRHVFLTLLAPFRPMARKTPGGIVSRRIHRIGLVLPHYGSHVLRHACASHLVASGLSLKEVGDHLGHRSPEATRVYAKVDLGSLRLVGELELKDLL